jgi:hypothetical protein
MCGGKRERFEVWGEKGIWDSLKDNEKLFRPFRPEYIRCIYTQAVGLGWFISPPSGAESFQDFPQGSRKGRTDERDFGGGSGRAQSCANVFCRPLRDLRSFRCVDPRLKPMG